MQHLNDEPPPPPKKEKKFQTNFVLEGNYSSPVVGWLWSCIVVQSSEHSREEYSHVKEIKASATCRCFIVRKTLQFR